LPIVAAGVYVVVLTVLVLSGLISIANSREQRVFDRSMTPQTTTSQRVIAVARETSDFDGNQEIRRVLIGAIDTTVHLPGVERLPRNGECFVSPALAALLEGNSSLAQRHCGGEVSQIGADGLADGRELIAYIGVDPEDLHGRPGTERVVGFGSGSAALSEQAAANATIRTVAVTGSLILIIPLGMLLATATGMAVTERELRLSSLALLGVSRVGLQAVIAGEILVGAGVGAITAVVSFMFVRSALDGMVLFGLEWSAADIAPSIIWLLVPTVVVWMAVRIPRWTLRHAIQSPLAVRRRLVSDRRARSIWYLPLAASLVSLFIVVAIGKTPPIDTAATGAVIVFYATIIASVASWFALYPATRQLGGLLARMSRRTVLLIAGRRMERAQPAAIRPGASVAIAIVLLGLGLFTIRIAELGAVEYLINTSDTPGGRSVMATNPSPSMLTSPVQRMEGIESVVLLTVADPGVVIADCADLEALLGADATACRDDRVSAVQYQGVDPSPIATEGPLEMSVVDDSTGEETVYETHPPTAVITLPQPGGDLGFGIQYFVPTSLADPLATDPNRLIVIHDGRAGAEESVRQHLYSADPTAEVTSSAQSIARGIDMTRGFTGIVTGIAVVIASALLLAVALQTVDGIEQRRRDTAALIMAGTPYTLLRRAEAITVSSPMILAFSISFLVLLLADFARSRVVGAPLHLDTTAYLLVGGVATAGIILIGWLATVGIPREPSRDNLRYE
jgi:hypothetical protein